MTIALPIEPLRNSTGCIGDTVVGYFDSGHHLIITPRQNSRGKVIGTVSLELKLKGQTLAVYTCKNPTIAVSRGGMELRPDKASLEQFYRLWRHMYDSSAFYQNAKTSRSTIMRRADAVLLATKPDLDDLVEELDISAIALVLFSKNRV